MPINLTYQAHALWKGIWNTASLGPIYSLSMEGFEGGSGYLRECQSGQQVEAELKGPWTFY